MQSSAGLLRRFGAGLYETLILIALWMCCVLGVVLVAGPEVTPFKRGVLQCLLWAAAGFYFVWCWSRSGQTLATQTWRIKLVNHQGLTLNVREALFRYILASASAMAIGAGFLWAFADREQLFLHDRLLGTRLIMAN
jgi:uncharacterized RDD family membrane protein YckC